MYFVSSVPSEYKLHCESVHKHIDDSGSISPHKPDFDIPSPVDLTFRILDGVFKGGIEGAFTPLLHLLPFQTPFS